MAAVSTMHTVLLCAPSHVALLQPALQAALRVLLDPDMEADCNELALASITGLAYLLASIIKVTVPLS